MIRIVMLTVNLFIYLINNDLLNNQKPVQYSSVQYGAKQYVSVGQYNNHSFMHAAQPTPNKRQKCELLKMPTKKYKKKYFNIKTKNKIRNNLPAGICGFHLSLICRFLLFLFIYFWLVGGAWRPAYKLNK